MDITEAQQRIESIQQLLLDEARAESEDIIEEGQAKANQKKNHVFGNLREGLINHFAKKDDDEKTRIQTLKSRRINGARIVVQEKRNALLQDLRQAALEKVSERLKDVEFYRGLLQKMIVQGLTRLLEKKVKIRCRAQDTELVKSVIPGAKKEFEEFLKENTGKEVNLKLTLIPKPLEKAEGELGGVILYCQNNKIVFTNTIDARLDLGFQESIPDIRHGLFPSKVVVDKE